MHTNNKTILDLNKVQHASFYYINQDGESRQHKPKGHTVHNIPIDGEKEWQTGRCAVEVAKERGMLDTWIPKVVFQLTANHNISYTGEKAVSLWEAWRAKIFGKN